MTAILRGARAAPRRSRAPAWMAQGARSAIGRQLSAVSGWRLTAGNNARPARGRRPYVRVSGRQSAIRGQGPVGARAAWAALGQGGGQWRWPDAAPQAPATPAGPVAPALGREQGRWPDAAPQAAGGREARPD